MKFAKLTKALVMAAALTVTSGAFAEWKPSGPITVEVGFGAGGSTDTLGRAIATSMEEATGWDVVVKNKPGGGGIAMFSTLVKEKPDGLTIGMGVTVPTLMNLAKRGDKLPFKIDSFDYLATVVLAPGAIVAPADAPYDNFAEFAKYSKEKGGSLVGFDGSNQRMIMNAINKSSDTGIEMVSNKSGAETIQGLLGGQLQAGFAAGEHIQYLKSGDLKMLAVVTEARHGYSPDTESLIEQGFPYSFEPYFYFAAPAGLEPEAKAALSKALDDAINSEAMAKLIVDVMKTEPTNLGPEGTAKKMESGLVSIGELIKAGE